jgi:hypothetical protein
VKQELALNHALYKSSRRLSGLVSSCLQELSFPWYLFVGEMFLFELFLNYCFEMVSLQQLGFEVGTSHTNPQGIKSNAPPSVSHLNSFEF